MKGQEHVCAELKEREKSSLTFFFFFSRWQIRGTAETPDPSLKGRRNPLWQLDKSLSQGPPSPRRPLKGQLVAVARPSGSRLGAVSRRELRRGLGVTEMWWRGYHLSLTGGGGGCRGDG